MTYFPIPVEQFGGLNLADDPGEVGFSGAVNILDVDLDHLGRVRSRDHYEALVANTTLTGPTVINWPTHGTLAATAASIKLYDTAGALVGTAVAPAQYYPGGAAAFGTPTTSYLYLADESAGTAIRRLTTAGVISAPAGMPAAKYLTRTPNDNRLMAANNIGNPHTVRFSLAGNGEGWGETAQAVTGVAGTGVFTAATHGYLVGDAVYVVATAGGSGITAGQLYYVNTVPSANTFTVSTSPGGSTFTYSTNLTAGTVARDNNYVTLDPGDGEDIQGACTWRDLTFVFKVSKFYVFFGTSTNFSGNPTFNYRAIRNTAGTLDPGIGPPIAVAPDGVYFGGIGGTGGYGIYRTTGTEPVRISQAIDPCLNGYAPSFFTPGNMTNGVGSATYAGGRCSFALVDNSAVSAYIFHYRPASGAWTVDYTAAATITHLASNPYGSRLLVTTEAANAPIHQRVPESSVSDSLHTPSPVYQSGFESLAPPRRYIDKYGFGPSRKRVPRWRVAGTGTVTMAVAADLGSTKGATSLTLGVSPAIVEKPYQWAIRGAKVSYKLSGAGPWSVSDLVAMLADTREPGSDVSDS